MNSKMLLSALTFKRRRGSDVKLKKTGLLMHGQTSPVVVNANGKVLFQVDEETCQAAKELGWTEITVYCKANALHPCG